MPTLKRSLFIGLGGTGASALLQTKKRFLDTYGEIPPMIGFLSIDTDFNTQTKSIDRDIVVEGQKDQSQDVKFDNSELIYTNVNGATQAYEQQKESLFDWMPEENEHVLRNMANGAGQVRSNGRFALHFNYNQIIESVQNKINQLLNININDNPTFEPKGNSIEINFVFSVGGGTGSGTYIDIAYLVKEAIGTANNTTSIAFIVMPDVFNAMQNGPSMMNVRPNGFGAMKDLDFLMQNNINNLGLELKYQNKTIPIKSPPFDVVFTVNNKNTVGETISDIGDIAEQIGLAMFTGASELSANINSAYDNIMSVLSGGVLDIVNKKAWAGGMGVSELFYDGNTMGNIYARRAISSMIVNLTTASNDSQRLADQFIDNPDISIRENNGIDNLIDSLLSAQPKVQFPYLDDLQDLNNKISGYLDNLKNSSQSEIQTNYDLRYSKVVKGLKLEVNKIVNNDSGVANCKEFLEELGRQVGVFNLEMQSEENDLQNQLSNLDLQIKEDINYLSTTGGFGSIFKRGEISNTKRSTSDNVNQKAYLINEILRRQFAQKFLNGLEVEIDDFKQKVNVLVTRLGIVKTSSLNKAAGFQNHLNEKSKTFVIDLHKEDINSIYVHKNDCVIIDFIASLSSNNKLYDFYSTGEEVIEDYFWNYAKQLKKAIDYKNKNIDDVLRGLNDDRRKELAKQLISKSNALWSNNLKGYVVGNEIHDDFVIGVPSENSIFKESFKTLLNAQNISFVNTGIKNRVVCYRMEVAVPIYAVNDMEGYEKDYNNSRINHHIDENWLFRMKRENFSIWPEKKEDHSLEAWVLGFVYNFIKFDDGMYKLYSEEKGDALDDYWTHLSQYRDESFDIFKKNDHIHEIISLIEEKRKNDGEDTSKDLIKNVVSNYKDSYSQINLNPEDLRKREYSKIADLLRKEIDFTRKELK